MLQALQLIQQTIQQTFTVKIVSLFFIFFSIIYAKFFLSKYCYDEVSSFKKKIKGKERIFFSSLLGIFLALSFFLLTFEKEKASLAIIAPLIITFLLLQIKIKKRKEDKSKVNDWTNVLFKIFLSFYFVLQSFLVENIYILSSLTILSIVFSLIFFSLQ